MSNNNILYSLVSEFSIPCNLDSHDSSVCESCQEGKNVRLPFSSSSSSSTFPFELLHYDIWTSPHASISGFQYYLILLYDFTHFVWTFPLRKKIVCSHYFSFAYQTALAPAQPAVAAAKPPENPAAAGKTPEISAAVDHAPE